MPLIATSPLRSTSIVIPPRSSALAKSKPYKLLLNHRQLLDVERFERKSGDPDDCSFVFRQHHCQNSDCMRLWAVTIPTRGPSNVRIPKCKHK